MLSDRAGLITVSEVCPSPGMYEHIITSYKGLAIFTALGLELGLGLGNAIIHPHYRAHN